MSRPLVSLLQTTKKILGIGLLLALCAFSAQAQGNFQSGSTGADGAFNPTTTQTIAVPESGVFNFTTVTIPSGVTVTFAPNSSNTPLTILASGDVVISGTINVAGKAANVNGTGGLGGPGGFAGGNGGFGVADLFSGQNGSGPGGGKGGSSNGSAVVPGGGGGYATVGSAATAASPTAIGSSYGSGLIQPLIGGSGGGAGGAGANSLGGAGGGGGGAILIASSTNITLNSTATIDASGGVGANATFPSAPGGGGSGGAIRLIANIISGNGIIRVNGGNGGAGGSGGGRGGLGYIRAEGFTLTSFTPIINQNVIPTQPTVASLGLPNPIVLANAPAIKILSVAGINAPTNPKGTLQAIPDILIPNTQTNPVSVELEGRNLPANIGFTVTVTPSTGTPSSVTSILTQSISPGVFTGSVQIELPAGLSVISATAMVDLFLAGIPDMVIDGEKIVKMEIKATYGQDSQISYITDKGKRIVK